jgi:uncharacterized sulfatase
VDYFTDQALAFIDRNQHQPWFLYLSHHTLHGVVSAPAPLVEEHRERGAPATGLHNATYLAAIEHLDRSIGRLVQGLRSFGLTERTLVVFLSDNGGVNDAYDVTPFTKGPGTATQLQVQKQEFANSPLRAGKGSPYEGGIRVPCIVRWPGVIAPGQTCRTPIHIIDWLPTLLAVGGGSAPVEHPVDGVSLISLFRGGTIPERALTWYLPLYDLRWGSTPCAVIRVGPWKLINYFGDWFDNRGAYHRGAHLELYNLTDDLGERDNLARENPQRATELQRELRSWLESVPAEIPGRNPRFDPRRPLKETRVKPAQ